MLFVGVEVEQETSAPPPNKILDPPLSRFFSTFDMDKLGKIQRYHWKDRVNQ